MVKYAGEFIGTFFLVLTIGCVVIAPGAGPLAPLAIGAALMVMVYANGHVSGAHFNPAVTLAVWLRGKCPSAEVPFYMGAQVAGGIVAAIVALVLRGAPSAAPAPVNVVRGLLAEALFTFALAYVVLSVATSRHTAGNSYFGLAIGFTVLTGAFAVGGISGGAFNPAVAIGVSIMGVSAWSSLWVLLVGDLIGGALAGLAFKAINSAEMQEEARGLRDAEFPAERETVGT